MNNDIGKKPNLVVISDALDAPLSVHLDTPSPLYEQINAMDIRFP